MRFDLFRTSSTSRRTDKVWLSRDHKYRGICREIAEVQRVRGIVVVVAFFRRAWTELADRLAQQAIRHTAFQETVNGPVLLSLFTRTPEGGVSLVLAEAAGDAAYGDHSQPPIPAVPRRLLVVEHYPLRARDEAVEKAAARLPFPHSLTFHSALDEPLFQRYGSERIVPLWKSLGMPEDDCIEHEAIAKVLANAQKAVGREVRAEIRADSAEDWFAHNLPVARG
jgi:preprotein translocase subunit SecA